MPPRHAGRHPTNLPPPQDRHEKQHCSSVFWRRQQAAIIPITGTIVRPRLTEEQLTTSPPPDGQEEQCCSSANQWRAVGKLPSSLYQELLSLETGGYSQVEGGEGWQVETRKNVGSSGVANDSGSSGGAPSETALPPSSYATSWKGRSQSMSLGVACG